MIKPHPDSRIGIEKNLGAVSQGHVPLFADIPPNAPRYRFLA
jgi:hypothetical protein